MCSTSLLLCLSLLGAGLQQSSAVPNDATIPITPTTETPTTATLTTLVATSEAPQTAAPSAMSQAPLPVSETSTMSSILFTKLGVNIKRVKDNVKLTGQYDTEEKPRIRTILRNQNFALQNKEKRGKKIRPLDYIVDKQEKMKPKTRTFGALFALAALTGINPLANPFQFISPGHNTLHIITVYRRRFPFFVDPVYYYDTNYAYYDDYGNYNNYNYDTTGTATP